VGSYANANGVGYPKGCVATRERFAQQLGKRNVVREAAKGSSVFMGPGELQRPSVSEFPGALVGCDGKRFPGNDARQQHSCRFGKGARDSRRTCAKIGGSFGTRAECDGSQRQRCPDAHPDKQWLRRECP